MEDTEFLMKELRKSRKRLEKLEKLKQEEFENSLRIIDLCFKHNIKQTDIAKNWGVTAGRVHQIKVKSKKNE